MQLHKHKKQIIQVDEQTLTGLDALVCPSSLKLIVASASRGFFPILGLLAIVVCFTKAGGSFIGRDFHGRLGMLIHEINKLLESATTLVVNDLVRVGREELESRKALNAKILKLVGSGIQLGNNNVIDGGKLLTQLVPNGCKLLAVTAPWSVEFDENILGRIASNLSKVLASQHLDGFLVPILRNLLRAQVAGKLVAKELVGKSGEGLGGDRTSECILRHVTGKINDTNSRKIFLIDAKVLEDAEVISLAAVNVNEEQLATVLLGNSGHGSHQVAVLCMATLNKEQTVNLDVTAENLGCVLVAELNDKGQALLADKLGNIVRAGF
eukprot:m.254117 g.254117  ORF g.254117 m.254117 type:complete len:325 (-) comp17707_c0_seq1:708-1682(-)